MSHGQYTFLFDQVQQMDKLLLTEENVGESQQVHQKIHDDPEKEQSTACKKLLLGLGDNNDLADEVERYLWVTFQAKLVLCCASVFTIVILCVPIKMHQECPWILQC